MCRKPLVLHLLTHSRLLLLMSRPAPVPLHLPAYADPPQRNGEDLLDHPGRLNSLFVDRYTRYANSAAASADAVPFFMLPNTGVAPVSLPHHLSDERRNRRIPQPTAPPRMKLPNRVRSARKLPRGTTTISSASYTQSSSASSASCAPSTAAILMPISVSLASRGVHPSVPQPSALPPTFACMSSSASTAYPRNLCGTGPRYPLSVGVSFTGAYQTPAPSASSQYSSFIFTLSAFTNCAPSYIRSTRTTPTPRLMLLRAAHVCEYEYDGESTDLEGVGGVWNRGASTYPDSSRPPLLTPRHEHDDLTAHMGPLSTGGTFCRRGRAAAPYTSRFSAAYSTSFAPPQDPLERAREDAPAAVRAAAARADTERAVAAAADDGASASDAPALSRHREREQCARVVVGEGDYVSPDSRFIAIPFIRSGLKKGLCPQKPGSDS
ncbi:hypothetical protein DFH09DRAFT_1094445 [Mycena vulgaris]|nr:hypothetical protein DFH09DRAFT_1094445 [Mycena vulgaris]